MSPAIFFHRLGSRITLATTAIAISIGLQGIALAHPGHGITHDGDTTAHYLLEPSHGISLVFVLAAALAAGIIISRAAAAGKQTIN